MNDPTTDSIGPSTGQSPRTLVARAKAIVLAEDPFEKVRLARQTSEEWRLQSLSVGTLSIESPMPERPGRPSRPELRPPREMARRTQHGERGRIALLHALAHIELNAVDMTWDLVGRFAHEPLPKRFFDDWVEVGRQEADHFALVTGRLAELGASYGDLPAHDGLWQAAQATGHSLIARLAVVPLVLEARGLDVTPSMLSNLETAGDHASAAVLEVIYREEKHHVACGVRWFRFLAAHMNVAPEPLFHDIVRRNFRGPIKPPFNDPARSEAGLAPGFYKPLAAIGYAR